VAATSVILTLRKVRQEDLEFEASLGYIRHSGSAYIAKVETEALGIASPAPVRGTLRGSALLSCLSINLSLYLLSPSQFS
jgi:hypothetical protein